MSPIVEPEPEPSASEAGGDGGDGGDWGGCSMMEPAMIKGSHCGGHAAPATPTPGPWIFALRDENKPGFVRMGVSEEPRRPCCEESGPLTSQFHTGE